jgi:hypothetical protein
LKFNIFNQFLRFAEPSGFLAFCCLKQIMYLFLAESAKVMCSIKQALVMKLAFL